VKDALQACNDFLHTERCKVLSVWYSGHNVESGKKKKTVCEPSNTNLEGTHSIPVLGAPCTDQACQVRVYSGRGSGQVQTKADEGQGQRAGQEVSPAGVGDRLDSTTKDNER